MYVKPLRESFKFYVGGDEMSLFLLSNLRTSRKKHQLTREDILTYFSIFLLLFFDHL